MEKGKTMMIAIIVLLVILLATICGVSYVMITTLKSNDATTAGSKPITSGKVLDPAEIYTYQLASPIAINLAVGSDGVQHSASVEIGIGIDNTDKKNSANFITLIQTQEVVVRDVVISVLRSKTIDEMNQPDSQEVIRQEILEKLCVEFNSDLIYDVYFGTFYYD